MKKCILLVLLSAVALLVFGGEYNSLDQNDPIVFGGDHIIYKGQRIDLGPRSFFIDGQLSDEVVAKYPYVFCSINDAAEHLQDGTEDEPMVLHIAPYVYWIDDPDDPEIRIPQAGEGLPYGMIISCQWLTFRGLNDDPRNVVLACNRGQTMGAKGNFTMFKISGDGTRTENITMGNYCNVDLEYPLLPKLNRAKRGNAVVQAQLVITDGDKIVCRNTRFISRLNLCPFVGGNKRVLFEKCHFESTDDALCGTGVYLDCTLDFYAPRPFYNTVGTGAVFLNCDLRSFSSREQFFTKDRGQVVVVDSRLTGKYDLFWGWRDFPADESRNYQYNITLNSKPYIIGVQRNPNTTVDMSKRKVLDAYLFEYEGRQYYNTYNLLKGHDDWDPLGVKETVKAAEQKSGRRYTNIPVQMSISPTRDSLETGKDKVILRPKVKRFGNIEVDIEEDIEWKVAEEYKPYVQPVVNKEGGCEITPTNDTDHPRKVIVTARSSSGLESAAVLYILPPVLKAPTFVKPPTIVKQSGKLFLDYTLSTDYEDQSNISWYRCSDMNGGDPIETAVSWQNLPKREYELQAGDVDKYIMAVIEPKDLRSDYGKTVKVISPQAVSDLEVMVDPLRMDVDLQSLSLKRQPRVIQGYWTADAYAPEDTNEYLWTPDADVDPWYYGAGMNGAANDIGLVQATKGARLRYTPVGDRFGDMKVSFVAVPAKTAGQGFGSATAQYMDIFIKLDTKTMNGYALRIVRTTKYHNAVDFVFVRYEGGKAVPIGDPVSTSCYRPSCFINLEVEGNRLVAQATSVGGRLEKEDELQAEVVEEVSMSIEIEPNDYGGMGFQHTGSVHGGATLIKDLKIEWGEK